jgi:hypothetical protein
VSGFPLSSITFKYKIVDIERVQRALRSTYSSSAHQSHISSFLSDGPSSTSIHNGDGEAFRAATGVAVELPGGEYTLTREQRGGPLLVSMGFAPLHDTQVNTYYAIATRAATERATVARITDKKEQAAAQAELSGYLVDEWHKQKTITREQLAALTSLHESVFAAEVRKAMQAWQGQYITPIRAAHNFLHQVISVRALNLQIAPYEVTFSTQGRADYTLPARTRVTLIEEPTLEEVIEKLPEDAIQAFTWKKS